MVVKRPQNATERLILALDVDTLEEAKSLVTQLKDYVGYFKVGLQLYTACGYDSVKMIHDMGAKVFFDAKFHDIPCRLCREVAKKYNKPTPTILGVTLLSSFGQKTLNQELNVNMNIDEYVSRLAKVALEAKLDGVVASASEVGAIRRVCGDEFIIVCPAIRPTWSVVDDQVRVVTPTDAIEAGVDYMVVGRPVISAKDKIEAITLIIDEIEEAKETIKERL